MVDVVELAFRVNTKEVVKGVKDLDNLHASGSRVEKSNTGLSNSFGKLRAAVATLGLAVLARQYVQLADTYKNINARLKLATQSVEEFNRAQSALNQIANATGSSLESTYKLYTRLSVPLRELGYQQTDLIRTTDLVSKALITGGASAEQQSAALLQLSQAFSRGVLRGDEFVSLMENGTGLAKAFADGLGIPVSALDALAKQGLLTTEVLVAALLRQEQAINDTYEELPLTAGRAWQMVKNEVTLAIGAIDAELGASQAWAETLRSVAEAIGAGTEAVLRGIAAVAPTVAAGFNAIATATKAIYDFMRPLIPYLTIAVATFLSMKLGTIALAAAILKTTTVIGYLVAAFNLLKVALLTNPITLILTGIALGVYAIYEHWEPFKKWWVELWGGTVETVEESGEGINDTMQAELEKLNQAGEQSMDKWEQTFGDGLGRTAEQAEEMAGKFDEITNALEMQVAQLVLTAAEYRNLELIQEGYNKTRRDEILQTEQLIKILQDHNATVDEAERVMYEHDMQQEIHNTLMKHGAEAAREKELVLKHGLDPALAAAQASQEEYNRAQLEGLNTSQRLIQQYKIQAEELLKGEEAGRRLALAYRNVGGAMQDNVIANWKYVESLKAQKEFLDDFRDALVDSILDADNVKDAFESLGDWMLDWLKRKIAEFAANQILIHLNFMTPQGGLGSFFTGAGNGLLGLLGGGGGVGGSVLDSVKGGGTLPSSGAGLAGSLSAAAGPAAAIFAGVAGLSSIIGTLTKKTITKGIELAFSGGEIEAQFFTETRKQRIFQSTIVQRHYSELDAETTKQLTDFFDSLETNITSAAQALGVSSASSIMDSFEVAMQEIKNEDQMAEFLENTTIGAYQHAFDQMGPGIQAAILSGLSPVNTSMEDLFKGLTMGVGHVKGFEGSIYELGQQLINSGADAEEIAARFETVATVATQVVPAFEAMGMSLGSTFDAAVMAGTQLVDNLGGLEAAMPVLNVLFGEMLSEFDQLRLVINSAGPQIDAFNEKWGLVGDQAVISSDQLLQLYQAEVDAGRGGGEFAAALLQLLPVILAAEQAAEDLGNSLQAASEDLTFMGVSAGNATPVFEGAAEAMIEAAGGAEKFASAMDIYYNEWLTEKEQEQFQYAKSTLAVGEFNRDLQTWMDSMGLGQEWLLSFSDGVIDTEPELRALKEALEDMGLAGTEMWWVIIQMLPGMKEFAEGGMSLQEAIASLPPEFQNLINTLLGIPPPLNETTQALVSGIEKFNFSARAITAKGGPLDKSGGIGASLEALKTSMDGVVPPLEIVNTDMALLQESLVNMADPMGLFTTDMVLMKDNLVLMSEPFTLFNTSLTLFKDNVLLINEPWQVFLVNWNIFAEELLIINEPWALFNTNMVLFGDTLVLINAQWIVINTAMVEFNTNLTLINTTMILLNATLVIVDTQWVALNTTLTEFSLTLVAIAVQWVLFNTTVTEFNTNLTLTNTLVVVTNEQLVLLNASVLAFNTATPIMIEGITQLPIEMLLALTTMQEGLSTAAEAIITESGNIVAAFGEADAAMETTAGVYTTGAGEINTAAGTATTALDAVAGAITSLASAAQAAAGAIVGAAGEASRAVGIAKSAAIDASGAASLAKAAASIASASASSARSAESSARAAATSRTVLGSFSSGLYNVPHDNFIASLHQGEMVMPADVSSWLRRADVISDSQVQGRVDNTSQNVISLQKDLRRIDQRLADNQESVNANNAAVNKLLSTIANASVDQVQGLADVDRSTKSVRRAVSAS